jgi:hypothetical protein
MDVCMKEEGPHFMGKFPVHSVTVPHLFIFLKSR